MIPCVTDIRWRVRAAARVPRRSFDRRKSNSGKALASLGGSAAAKKWIIRQPTFRDFGVILVGGREFLTHASPDQPTFLRVGVMGRCARLVMPVTVKPDSAR